MVSSPVHIVQNVPPPSWLREEARIQEKVQNRMRHLSDHVKPGMNKIKSPRDGTVFGAHKVRWPMNLSYIRSTQG